MSTAANKDLQRKMAWGRWIFGVCVAVFVAIWISTSLIRDALMQGCVRNGESKIIDAQFYDSSAAYRSGQGANEQAQESIDFSHRKRATIPMPEGWHGNPAERGDNPQDRKHGCEDAYPSVFQLIFS